MELELTHKLLEHMKRGKVYRRADLKQYATSIDRDLKELCDNKEVLKLSPGLYCRPKHSAFGLQPPEDKELVRSFLKDSRFLITSFNHFNSLGLGFTQLYNSSVVYSFKRHGRMVLASKIFEFKRVSDFPKKLSKEYLVVDLLNNSKLLVEDEATITPKLKENFSEFDSDELMKIALKYGRARTKDFIKELYVAH